MLRCWIIRGYLEVCLRALGHAVHVGLVEDLQVGRTEALCQLSLHAFRHRAFQNKTQSIPVSSVLDPHCFQWGSGFSISLRNRIHIRDFDDQKLEKITAEEKFIFFWSKIAIYLSLSLHKGPPNYRKSLQPSKKNILKRQPTRRPSRATDLLRGIPGVHIALTRYTLTCVLSVSPALIQIYWTVLYCPPFCSVVLFMPPPQSSTWKLEFSLLLWVILTLLDPVRIPNADPCGSGSTMLPVSSVEDPEPNPDPQIRILPFSHKCVERTEIMPAK